MIKERKIKSCLFCGKPITTGRIDKKYCNKHCRREAELARSRVKWAKMKSERPTASPRPCECCGTMMTFEGARPIVVAKKMYCSTQCSNAAQAERRKRCRRTRIAQEIKDSGIPLVRHCEFCGKEFALDPDQGRGVLRRKFCSPECCQKSVQRNRLFRQRAARLARIKPTHCRECGKEVKYLRRRLCNACYRRWMRKHKPRRPRICRKCGRKRTIVGRGLCDSCYAAQYYRPSRMACRNCGKERIEWSDGLCGHCWHESHQKIVKCAMCGEEKLLYARDMCARCYSRWYYHQLPTGICSICGKENRILFQGRQICVACYGLKQARKRGVRPKGDIMSGPQHKIFEFYQTAFPNDQVLANHRLFTNPGTGREIDVDIWIPSQGLAIEVDGPHHRKPIWGKESLEYTQKMDTLKDRLAAEADIHLIRIPVE